MTESVNSWYNGAMSAPDPHEEQFHKLIALLASRCQVELDEIELEIWDQKLSPYGYKAACIAIVTILAERSAGDRLPSVGDVLGRMGLQTTPKALAIDVTNKIAAAVGQKGYTWRDRFKTDEEYQADQLRVLGEAGVEVVRRLGGWTAVIEFANGNPSYYKTWVRDTAIGVIEMAGPKYLALPAASSPTVPALDNKSRAAGEK